MSIYNLIMRTKEEIGKNVRRIRKEKLGETQEKFAENIGASKDTVSNLERGEFFPSIPVLINIAVYAKVSTDQILGIEEFKDKI